MKQAPAAGLSELSLVGHDPQSDYLSETNIFNLLPSGLCVIDKNGLIIHYNQKAVDLWGRTPDSKELFFGARNLFTSQGNLIPGDNSPISASLTDGVSRQEEMIMESSDGRQIIIEAAIIPVKDPHGHIAGLTISFNDITGYKKTEKELQFKTRELEDYVDNAAIGLHWVDGNGIIKWANKAELDMLGYTKEEYIGHHISEFHVQKDKINDILTRLNCNETLDQYESEIRLKTGASRPSILIQMFSGMKGSSCIHAVLQ